MPAVTIRRFAPGDAEATAQLFYDSVRVGADRHYDASQRALWAPAVPETRRWAERLAAMTTLVAVDGGTPVGFMSLDAAGHLDLAFVRPDRMGKGVAARLYDALERTARAGGLERLSADASLGLRPFLEARGWTVRRRQTPVRNGVALVNFAMEKRIAP